MKSWNKESKDIYLRNGVSKSIVHVIKHANFQLYRAHPDGVIWKKPTIDGKYKQTSFTFCTSNDVSKR